MDVENTPSKPILFFRAHFKEHFAPRNRPVEVQRIFFSVAWILLKLLYFQKMSNLIPRYLWSLRFNFQKPKFSLKKTTKQINLDQRVVSWWGCSGVRDFLRQPKNQLYLERWSFIKIKLTNTARRFVIWKLFTPKLLEKTKKMRHRSIFKTSPIRFNISIYTYR